MAMKYEAIIPLPLDYYLSQVAPGQLEVAQVTALERGLFMAFDGRLDNATPLTLIKFVI